MVAIAVWVVACAALLFLARRDLRQGVDLLEDARDRLGPVELTESEGLNILRRAEREFDSADRLVDWPVLTPMRVLPVLGRQVRSVDALAGAAHGAGTIGTDAVETARDLLDRFEGSGGDRVQLAQGMGALAERARTALEDLDLGPRDALFGPLRDARRRFEEEREELVSSLAEAEDAARGLADFLEGPSRYLVMAANNAEMRAGSGMFLSAGMLTVRDGRLSLGEMSPTEELLLPGKGVRLPRELDKLWGWLEPGREWRQLAASPRFDVTAELASRMWEAAGQPRVDGVLSLDVEALAAVLRVVGPVDLSREEDVDLGGGELDADEAVRELLHDQYVGVSYDDDQRGRREQLGVLASATVDQLEQSDADAAELAEALADAARGRHVLAWARPDSQRRAWQAAGVGGELEPNSLMAAVLNVGGNKLDQFLQGEGRIDVRRDDDAATVEVRLALHNQVPEGEAPYITGPHPELDLAAGTYKGVVSFSLPGAASGVRVEGGGEVVASGVDGPSVVVAIEIDIPRGEELVVTVRFRLPGGVRELRVEPSARLPAVQWSAPSVRWSDLEGRSVPI